jgi:hypothetical protein
MTEPSGTDARLDRIEALEAKLAKAVEALRGRMHCHDCTCGECDHIRATLAEIEGSDAA